MIEHGKLVFAGTIDDFNNYVAPSSVILTMDTPPSMSMLQTIEDVSAVEKIDDYHYRVHFNASNNSSEKIVQLSVSNNWGLKEITLERQSLDNIFAQLSGKIKTLK